MAIGGKTRTFKISKDQILLSINPLWQSEVKHFVNISIAKESTRDQRLTAIKNKHTTNGSTKEFTFA